MANRNNTFLLKRSNIPGKIPTLSGLTIGELALNISDAKLYTLYTGGLTGATEVREIGWDKLSISGGTIYGSLKVNDTLTANTIHTTYIYDRNNSLGSPGQVLSITSSGVEWVNVTGTTGGGTTTPTTCNVNTVSTYGLEYKKIATISGFTQGSYIIKSYLSSFSGNTKYGFWERTLGVVTTGGTPTIIQTTEDFDSYSPNFLPSQIVYTPISSNNIEIYVSGLTSENLNWTSYYDIIGQNCGSSTSGSGNFTGNTSGDCISDIYVSNIHSCSPLYINPNDEGNVYFGSNNKISIDLNNSVLNINGSFSATTVYGSGLGLINIPISSINNLNTNLDSKTNLSEFVLHTGNTNNPHQTTFYNLVSTAHTHTISDVINLQSSLDSKFSLSGGTVNGNVIINGNVQILGSATTINTQTLSIADNVVTLNSNYSGNTAPFFGHSGIEVLRGSGTTAAMLWEEQNSQWEAGLHGTTKRIILQGDSLALLSSGHTHPISEINNLQSSLDSKFNVTGGTITSNVLVNGSLTATTFYGNGQYLTGLVTNDFYVTGGTFSGTTLTLNRQNGSVTITGFTDNFVTGGTFSGTSLTLNRQNGSIVITGFTSSSVNTFVTGFTYSNNNITLSQNQGQSPIIVNISTMTGLTVNGNLVVTGTSSFNTLTATTPVFFGTTNVRGNLVVTGTTLLNTLTATTPVFFGTTNVNGNLTVTGSTSLRSFTATAGTILGTGQSILTIVGSGSSTSLPLFTVQGSSGELFSVSDSLQGSLFSVNDISGLPILEVFSDNTTLMGSYLAPSLNTTVKTTVNTGTTTIYSIPTSAYTGAYFDYNVLNTAGARSGNIISIWSGNTVNYTETTTTDIGSTTPITFNMTVTSGFALLRASATTNSWTVKTIVRSI